MYNYEHFEIGNHFAEYAGEVPKFSDAKNFAAIYLQFKQRGQILGYIVKKMQMDKLTVNTLIRLLL